MDVVICLKVCIYIILCSNLHQFSPVDKAVSKALYYLINLATDSTDSQVGCMIMRSSILWSYCESNFMLQTKFGMMSCNISTMDKYSHTMLIYFGHCLFTILNPNPSTSTHPLGMMSHSLHHAMQYRSFGMKQQFRSIVTEQADSHISALQKIEFEIDH